jgi:type IV pilus assembly protein PilV
VPRPILNRSRCAGFTMVEALVALVVLSIGLLGVAGLQLTGLRANSSAASRSQASYLADDIIDRMRANRTEALAGSYNIALGTAATGTTIPKLDLIAWQADLTSLPLGKGSVAVDAVTGIATVSVQWVDSRGGDSNLCTGAQLDVCSPLTFVTATQL